jgi:hypothetical protein
MRVTISHTKRKEDVVKAVDQSFDDLFQNSGIIPLKIVDEKRSWTGTTMNFSFGAKMGLLTAPIKGFVAVTDTDLTIDADLGILERLIPNKQQAVQAIESKVRGLLR